MNVFPEIEIYCVLYQSVGENVHTEYILVVLANKQNGF